MATNASSHPLNPYPDSIGSKQLSIALISPSMERRAAAALALTRCSGGEVNEFTSYPPGLDDLPGMLDQKYDVVIIELDSDPEYALELVESIGSDGMATVMVYSASADPELLVRCMRAGAREFLTLPLAPEVMAEALVRAAARRPMMQTPEEDRTGSCWRSWGRRAAPARPCWPAILQSGWPRNRNRRRC